jgi:hypothetical protein
MTAYIDQSRDCSDRELVEVGLEDLKAKPLATLESIYRQLELPGFEAAAARFAAYLEGTADFEKNWLGLSDEERKAVRAALAPVFERWGYQ